MKNEKSFIKGHTKKGGRKAGTLNKTTGFSKSIIQEIATGYSESGKLLQDITELEPKERLDIMIKLMGYIIPKPQSVDMTVTDTRKKTIEDRLAELAEENEM